MNKVVLFDTGLLLRSSIDTLDHAELSLHLWEKARDGKIHACIAHQTVWEFFSVLTRLGIPHRKVAAEIKKHLQVFPLIAPRQQTFSNTLASLQQLRWLKGAQIYDLFLAHTGVDNELETLYTYNDNHFSRFNLPLRIINPGL